nr:Omp28 family outer membrane lipoprotein [Bacteroides sp.]
MKLKNLLYIPMIAAALTACSDVDENDRYIDTGEFTPARAVLIEDFTGQNCVNCPDAHEVIEALEKQYNQHGTFIIPVSIHAGGFAIKENRGGLATDAGEEYNAHWGIDSWPQGVIDRKGSPCNYDQWPTLAFRDMGIPATMAIDVTAVKAADNKSAKISVTVNPEVSEEASLQLWVVENGIVARQRKGNETIMDYVHNNVFRAAVNGTWGEKFTFSATELLERDYSLEFNEKWNPDNLCIVAFVYDSNGVVCVNRAPVK